MTDKNSKIPSLQDIRLGRLSKIDLTKKALVPEFNSVGKIPQYDANPTSPTDIVDRKQDTLVRARRTENQQDVQLPKAKSNGHLEPEVTEIKIKSSSEKCRSDLEALLHENKPWTELSELAWRQYELDPSPRNGSSVIELAYIHGAEEDLLQNFQQILSLSSPEFYFHIQAEIRSRVVGILYRSPLKDRYLLFLDQLFGDAKNLAQASKVEKFLHLLVSLKSKNSSSILSLLKANRHEIVEKMDTFFEQLGVDAGQSKIELANLATKCGETQFVVDIISSVGFESPYYTKALDILRDTQYSGYKAKSKDLLNKFAKSKNSKRILIIDQMLKDLSSEKNRIDITDVAVVNNLLSKLNAKTFQGENSGKILTTLLKHRSLIDLVPDLLAPIRDIHHKFDGNHKFFDGLGKFTSYDSFLSYFRGVHYLHLVVSNPVNIKEEELWKARDLVLINQSKVMHYGFQEWDDLVKECIHKISKQSFSSEEHRMDVIRMIAVTKSTNALEIAVVEDYLDHLKNPSVVVLKQLKNWLTTKKSKKLLFKLSQKLIPCLNQDGYALRDFWNVSANLEKYDLAWRVATVMDSRGELPEHLYHAWKVSGESRSIYIPNKLVSGDMVHGLNGFSDLQAKFITTLVGFRQPLSDLVCTFGYGVQKHKYTKLIQSPIQQQGFMVVDNYLGFHKYRTDLLNHGNEVMFDYVPPFVKSMPDQLWAHIFCLHFESMNTRLWGWNKKALKDLCNRLPEISKSNPKTTIKYVKWYRNLSPDQKRNWQDLAILCNQLSQREINDTLQIFSARLTFMAISDHRAGLKCMKAMGLEGHIIAAAETWIMSEVYSRFRDAHGISSKVPVPKVLIG